MTLSRNQKYELKQKEKGLKKITLWVPEDASVDFFLMADFCVNNPHHVPFMVRNINTGRMAKAV